MKIIDLSEKTQQDYFSCLEEWADDIKDGFYRKKCWYNTMKNKGLRVKLAINQSGVVCGMIQYVPVEYSWIEGEDLYFVYCIWVHGHKKGRGDMRKLGAGKALLQAAEEDVKALGSKGLVVWGLLLPFFMRSGWFKKHGYRKIERKGISVLLWKKFVDDATLPSWIKAKKRPELIPGKVVVTALSNGWCTGINGMIERAKRVSEEFGDVVVFHEVDMTKRENIRKWGLSDGLFINNKNVYKGPPLTYKQIRKRVEKKVKKLLRNKKR